MSREPTLTINDVVPDPVAVLRQQGVPVHGVTMPRGDGAAKIRSGDLVLPPGVPPRIRNLLVESGRRYLELARPRALLADVTAAEFAGIYAGNGQNEPQTPLAGLFPRARRLWLFALTLGEELSREIEARLADGDYAVGVMLDGWASEGAERAVARLEDTCRRWTREEEGDPSLMVLSYSPGYCGWNIRAQRELFEYLRPAAIGLSLNESCLMWPLKSVTGVLVAAPPDVHRFEDRFPFCRECRDRTCRRRMAQLAAATGESGPTKDRNNQP